MRTIDLLIGERVWRNVRVSFGSQLDRGTVDMTQILGLRASDLEPHCRFRSGKATARRLEAGDPENATGGVVWKMEFFEPGPERTPPREDAPAGSAGGGLPSTTRSSRRRLDFEDEGGAGGSGDAGISGTGTQSQGQCPGRRGRKRAADS